MRRVFVLLTVGLLAAPAGAAAKPVGFQVDLKDGQHIECFVSSSGSTLSCLNYTDTPSGACDAGGAVAGRVLTRNATKVRTKTFCVDEAYHGYAKLRAGATWHRTPFSCTVPKSRKRLSCGNAHGSHVLWTART